MNTNRSEYYSDTIIPKHQQIYWPSFFLRLCFISMLNSAWLKQHCCFTHAGDPPPRFSNTPRQFSPDKRRRSRPRNWWLVGHQQADPKIVDHLNHLDPNPQARRLRVDDLFCGVWLVGFELNKPIWKICEPSNWGRFLPQIGVKIPKIFETTT